MSPPLNSTPISNLLHGSPYYSNANLTLLRRFYPCLIRVYVYLETFSLRSCSSAIDFCKPWSTCSHGKGLGPVAILRFITVVSFSELLPCRRLPLLVLSCTTPGNILGGGETPSIQVVPCACDGEMIIDDDLAGSLCSRPVR